jgi:hypothetical protein
MEKVNKPLEVRLPPLDIYADDIKKICELIKKDYQHIELQVSTKNEEYKLEADEIEQIEDYYKIRKLYIVGYNESRFLHEVKIGLFKSPLYISRIESSNTIPWDAEKRHKLIAHYPQLIFAITALVMFYLNYNPKRSNL